MLSSYDSGVIMQIEWTCCGLVFLKVALFCYCVCKDRCEYSFRLSVYDLPHVKRNEINISINVIVSAFASRCLHTCLFSLHCTMQKTTMCLLHISELMTLSSQATDRESLHALEGLMNEFFGPTTTNNRKRDIETILGNFGQQRGAWKQCLYYVAHTHNSYVSMYCLTTLEVK